MDIDHYGRGRIHKCNENTLVHPLFAWRALKSKRPPRPPSFLWRPRRGARWTSREELRRAPPVASSAVMPPTTPTRFAAESTQVRMAATGSGVRSRYARAWGVGCSRPPALDRSNATGRRTCPSSCSSSSSTSRTRQSPTLARARGGQGAGFRLRLAPRALLPLHGLRRFVCAYFVYVLAAIMVQHNDHDDAVAFAAPAAASRRRSCGSSRSSCTGSSGPPSTLRRPRAPLRPAAHSNAPARPDGPRPVLTGATGATGVSSCLSRGCSTWGMCRDVVNYAVYWP